MEELKSLSTLLEPDERWANFVLHKVSTNEISPITLNDRYQSVSAIALSTAAPEDVRSQFNIALMLGVYAWLYYPFHQVAELKAFSTVEMALRQRFPEAKGALNKLLALAVEAGAIVDKGFSHIEACDEDPKQYSRKLPNIVSSLRNELAHGSFMLHPGSLFTLRNCAEIINQLFPEVK
ncbi:hypothetical protein GALL_336990 [mine drainage metagenome]|uniref:RiboL-PSP-HEPN domain-containing protein n=1 Tax=mine drainage metagenome TaxID=410659 RepID=A0A1J5QXI6_9ZZZZ